MESVKDSRSQRCYEAPLIRNGSLKASPFLRSLPYHLPYHLYWRTHASVPLGHLLVGIVLSSSFFAP